ncbi:autotransporter domain-containing protein [Sphingomonas sp. JC676]|uniref:autotransporter domain-containing protein n=1 Tax=Sphingomonas sp. JC676 TaxID=2768065 RepID=UPI00165826A9|nr:autotransporter domain-containing protein [Sphingomonas sp. JC676]MBC9035168.1 autotransporter domain-containing protein [Sphingomonas sp. JC676]
MPHLVRTATATATALAFRPQLRRSLRISTCASAVAAALLLMPGAALAQNACGAPVLGQVTCSLAAAPFSNGIIYPIASDAAPQDLTVHLEDGLSVETSGDYQSGITVTNWTGGVEINGSGGSITTHGTGSIGLAGVTDAGDLTIAIGDVRTEGSEAHGVVGRSVSGGITIDAGHVATSGYGASGIDVIGYSGAIAIHADTVETSGYLAKGLHAVSSQGSLSIDMGGIVTSGDFSAGIDAQGGQRPPADEVYYGNIHFGPDVVVDIKAGDIATAGYSADGIDAINFTNGTTNVSADHVATSGDTSWGIYAGSIAGAVNIEAGSVSTTGNYADGVRGVNLGTGTVSIHAGNVSTTGYFSHGIYASGDTGDVFVDAGSIHTSGNYSAGVRAVNYAGNLDIKAGDIETKGLAANGIIARNVQGNVSVDVGQITASGSGIQASSFNGDVSVHAGTIESHGTFGNGIISVSYTGTDTISAGSVTTTGLFATAIRAQGATAVSVDADHISTSGDYANGVLAIGSQGIAHVSAVRVETAGVSANGVVALGKGDIDLHVGTVVTQGDDARGLVAQGYGNVIIDAGSITTIGAMAHGIWVKNPDDDEDGESAAGDATPRDFAITAGSIKVEGAGAMGIFALGTGVIDAKVGTVIAADAQAIKLVTRQEAGLSITGTVASANGNGVEITGSDVTVAIAKGATVSGKVGLVANAAGPWQGGDETSVRVAEAAPGVAHIDNAGTITGDGLAIQVNSGRAIITNSGTLNGDVRTLSYDDSLTNSGTWILGAGTDFGDGNDTLINTGTIQFRGTAAATWATAAVGPQTVTLAGLETFKNNGLIDLRGGAAGDVLTIPGAYVGNGDARIGLDIGAGKADKLVIAGAATGSTTILLANLTPANATLAAEPLTLVTAGAGSAPDAFKVANGSVGLIQYGVAYNAASKSFGLVSTPGAPVYRLGKLAEGTQAIWLKSSESWTSHMAELRDTRDAGGRLWGQMFGGFDTRDASSTAGGASQDLGYRQDYYGGELGYDAFRSNGINAGVMAGYVSSKQRFQADGDRATYDAINVGGYAGLRKGAFFANALLKYDHYAVKVSSNALKWSDRSNADAFGAAIDAGARLGGDKFFVEPAAGLVWTSTAIGDLTALGQTLDFDRATGLRGKVGARLGGTTTLAAATVTLYAAGNYIHEFEGENGVKLISGGTSQHVIDSRLGDYGQLTLGMNVLSRGPLSGFIEGNANVGSSYSGGGGRAGIRLTF